jgi:S-adenosylmethionine hydrolase
MPGRPIAFITDLGTRDDAVGMCKGMMLATSPGSPIIDITHEVTPFDVEQACHYLRDLPEYMPADCVFCCVVYPETGSKVPSIAARNRLGQLFVAPDNGLLTHVLAESGLDEVHRVENPDVCRQPLSPSFYGRDVIVACAAHLAAGVPLQEVGPSVDDIVRLPDISDPPVVSDGQITGRITLIDVNFGNVWTDISEKHLVAAGLESAEQVRVRIQGDVHEWPLARTFSDVPAGAPLVYYNSRNRLSFALNKGNLAERIAVQRGTPVEIGPLDRTPARESA